MLMKLDYLDDGEVLAKVFGRSRKKSAGFLQNYSFIIRVTPVCLMSPVPVGLIRLGYLKSARAKNER